jgi:hypothetical protein
MDQTTPVAPLVPPSAGTRRKSQKQKWRRLAGTLGFLAICLAGMLLLGVLLSPNKTGGIGFNLVEYRREPAQTVDALLLGSSFVYSSYSPMLAWESHGIASYVAAGPEQSLNTTWATYRNCLGTQRPSVTMLDLRGISFMDKATSDAMASPVTGWYANLKAAMAGRRITSWPTAFYDFFTYHSRWKGLTKQDYTAAFSQLTNQVDPAFFKGYVHIPTANPQVLHPEWGALAIEEAVLNANLPYLDAIVELAAENNSRLVFLMTPATYVQGFDKYEAFVRDRYPDIPYLDLNDRLEEMAFSFETDMYDGGHTNASGAEKCTRVVAAALRDLGLADRRGDPAYAQWEADLEKYREAVGTP